MSELVQLDISSPEFLNWLETEALPSYFKKQRWYANCDHQSMPVLKLVELGLATSGLILGLVQDESAIETETDASRSPYLIACLASSNDSDATPGQIAAIPQAFSARPAVLVEAFATESGRNLLLQLLVDGDSVEWSTGKVRGRIFEQRHVEREKLDWHNDSCCQSGEQSNSSVVYHNSVILKLFRRPGLAGLANPDVEIPLALSLTTEHPLTPPVMGVLQSGDDENALMLGTFCRFLETAECGWDLALKAAEQATQHAGDEAAEITPEDFRLGRDLAIRTSELHVALSRIPDNDAFAPVPVKSNDLAELGRDLKSFGEQVFRRIGRLRLDAFSDEISAGLWYLLDQEPKILGMFDRIMPQELDDCDATLFYKIRLHGDYHLGQALFDQKLGWQVIDFEGEPSKSLTMRRRKLMALRDVAGMVRSFDYAQAVVAKELSPGCSRRKKAAQWRDQLVSIFTNTYFAMVGDVEHEIYPLIPADYRLRYALLDAFILEKNLYELIYEIEHRPDWVQVPLNGLLELVSVDKM